MTAAEVRENVMAAAGTIRSHKGRSFLTVLGIVIGVSTVIAIGAIVNGLNTNVVGQIESLGSNVIICYRFSFATLIASGSTPPRRQHSGIPPHL